MSQSENREILGGKKRSRKPHILKGTKKQTRPKNIIYFDSEANVDIEITGSEIMAIQQGLKVEKEHKTNLICACFCREGRQDIWKDYHAGIAKNFKRKFWHDVVEFAQYGQTTTLFAHNTKYDILATNGIIYLVELGLELTSFSEDNPFIVEFAQKNEEGKAKKIVILSTTNFFKDSVENLGRTFGLEKLEAAYNKSLEESIVYCRRDVEIIKKAMTEFYNFVESEKLGNCAKTLAGQSFNAYRARFLRHEIAVHCDELALEVEREAYSGGRTEAFHLGKIPEKLFTVDVNSMYPFVMRDFTYPVKLVSVREKMGVEKLGFFLDNDYLLCARVRLKTKLPIFPLKHHGKLEFPTGEFTTSLSTPELKKALEIDAIKKIDTVCIYEPADIFSDFVTFFYEKRLQAKAEKNDVLSYLLKILLNSLYGKFGQKSIDWEIIGQAPIDIVKVERIFSGETGTYKTMKIIGGLIMQNTEKSGIEIESYNSFPAIAAHVTAYARCLLWDYMTIAGIDTVKYCDTDSLFLLEKGYRRLEAAGVLHPKELGKLKLEKEGYFEIRGLKDYTLLSGYDYDEKKEIRDKVKIKGVSLKGLENGSTVQLDEKTYITSIWPGISRMMQEDRLAENYSTRLQMKKLERKYSKGIVTKSGRVKPFHYTGGEADD